MPNWCETSYRCVGDKSEVRALKKILDNNNRRKTPKVKNGFGTMWLGCIINSLGLNWEDYRCRGAIIDYKLDGDDLVIEQETAWCEQEGFRQAIEKKFPSIKVYYREEEPGCDVYYTNSFDYFPDRYFLDSNEEPLYFETLEEAEECVSSIVGYKVSGVTEIINACDKYTDEHEDDDVFYSFHEFQLSE